MSRKRIEPGQRWRLFKTGVPPFDQESVTIIEVRHRRVYYRKDGNLKSVSDVSLEHFVKNASFIY